MITKDGRQFTEDELHECLLPSASLVGIGGTAVCDECRRQYKVHQNLFIPTILSWRQKAFRMRKRKFERMKAAR